MSSLITLLPATDYHNFYIILCMKIMLLIKRFVKPYHQSALESAKTKLCLFRKPRATISENKVPIRQINMFILQKWLKVK